MKTINYLQFEGYASEVINYYEKTLPNAVVKKVLFGNLPENPHLVLSKEEKNMVMESSIMFLDNTIMISDIPNFMSATLEKITNGNSLIISLIDGDSDTNELIFNALEKDGQVIMPIGEVPWSKSFGLVIDKFGITWKFNSDATNFLNSFDN